MARAACLAPLAFVLAFALGACGDNLPFCDPAATAAELGAAPCAAAPCDDLFVVPHEDDDLLFMNPEILGSIRRGDRVVVLYTTAGELGERGNDQYWIDRERGELEAYAQMAGAATLDAYAAPPAIPPDWRVAPAPTLGGITATEYDLATAPVSLVFLHLGDAQEQCLWDQTTGCSADNPGGNTLPYVAVTKPCAGGGVSLACPAPDTLPVQHVTRDALIAAIADAIGRFQITSVDALDGTRLHFDQVGGATREGWTEYPDHYDSALFAIAAVAAARPTSLRTIALGLHRGYTVARAPENVAPRAACAKAAAFAHYAMFDNAIVHHPTPDGFPACLDCDVAGAYKLNDSESWERRMYAARTVPPGAGALAIGGACLGDDGHGAVTAVPCASGPAWSSTPRNQLAVGGSCLTASTPGPVALTSCDAARVDQIMLVFDNGQIRTSDAGCLTWDGAQLTDAACQPELGAGGHVTDDAPPAQRFTFGGS